MHPKNRHRGQVFCFSPLHNIPRARASTLSHTQHLSYFVFKVTCWSKICTNENLRCWLTGKMWRRSGCSVSPGGPGPNSPPSAEARPPHTGSGQGSWSAPLPRPRPRSCSSQLQLSAPRARRSSASPAQPRHSWSPPRAAQRRPGQAQTLACPAWSVPAGFSQKWCGNIKLQPGIRITLWWFLVPTHQRQTGNGSVLTSTDPDGKWSTKRIWRVE